VKVPPERHTPHWDTDVLEPEAALPGRVAADLFADLVPVAVRLERTPRVQRPYSPWQASQVAQILDIVSCDSSAPISHPAARSGAKLLAGSGADVLDVGAGRRRAESRWRRTHPHSASRRLTYPLSLPQRGARSRPPISGTASSIC
jgi:hypothetical protein